MGVAERVRYHGGAYPEGIALRALALLTARGAWCRVPCRRFRPLSAGSVGASYFAGQAKIVFGAFRPEIAVTVLRQRRDLELVGFQCSQRGNVLTGGAQEEEEH